MLLLLVMIGAVVGYDRSVNYWEAFEPGKLLQRLDALTLDAGQLPAVFNDAAPLMQQLPPTAQPKLDEDVYDDAGTDIEADAEAEAADDGDTDVDTDIIDHVTADDEVELASDLESAEAHSGEDYERNYEQFVRQYFDRVPEQENEDEYDNEQLDASIETQAEASSNVQKLKQKVAKKPKTNTNSKSKSKGKQKRDGERCHRVHRKGQLCKICREPRHNEVSETCSYSHEAEPEQYAYGSGSEYKRYRDKSPRKHLQEEEVEKKRKQQPAKRPQRSERHTTILLQPSNKNSSNNSSSSSQSIAGSDSSLCVRRQQGKSVCYDCKDSGGKRMTRCYDAAVKKRSRKSSAKPGMPRTRESQQSEQEQRIYKRTISYSYAQDSSPNEDQEEQLEPLPTSTPTASTTTTTEATEPVLARNVTQVTPRPISGRKLARVVRRRVALPSPIPYRS